MKSRFFLLALLFVASLAPHALGQSLADGSPTVPILPSSPPAVNCSPAPCVLPATLASEGTSADIYAPIAVNPKNPKQVIVGSDDGNCGISTQVGFHVSSDAGSNWSVTCPPALNEFGQDYDPFDLPLVAYDLKGGGIYRRILPGPRALRALIHRHGEISRRR